MMEKILSRNHDKHKKSIEDFDFLESNAGEIYICRMPCYTSPKGAGHKSEVQSVYTESIVYS